MVEDKGQKIAASRTAFKGQKAEITAEPAFTLRTPKYFAKGNTGVTVPTTPCLTTTTASLVQSAKLLPFAATLEGALDDAPSLSPPPSLTLRL